MNKTPIEENPNEKKSTYELILEEFDVLKTYETKLKLKVPKQSTIKTKVWAIVPFLRFIKNKDINQVTKDDVEGFYASIRDVRKTNTTRRYMIELRYFFKTFKIDNNFFEDIKIKKDKTRLDQNEILSKDEAMKIVQHARNYRDRALIFLLWDSAARLSELLNLKKKDVYFDEQGATISVDGKTEKRIIRLTDSFSDLDELYKRHTGSMDDFLFCLPDGKRLSDHAAQNIVSRAAKRAGTGKKVYPHLFRHSKLTWLAKKGMMEMHMRIFAGWSEESDMPATYLHLSNTDVQEVLMRISGMKTVERKEEVETSIQYCPRCNTMNSFDAIQCRHCSMVLDQTRVNPVNPELEQHKKEVEKELLKLKLKNNLQYLKMKRKYEPEKEKIANKLIEQTEYALKILNGHSNEEIGDLEYLEDDF